MGSFSIWHWLVVLLMLGNLAMIVHIAISSRTKGFKKGLFVVAAVLLPFVPYIIWLMARDSGVELDVKVAQAKALKAEAEAREAEAKVRLAKAQSINQ